VLFRPQRLHVEFDGDEGIMRRSASGTFEASAFIDGLFDVIIDSTSDLDEINPIDLVFTVMLVSA
jgi:hypothetical protein